MKKTLADKAKKYYNRGLWTEEMLVKLVNKDETTMTLNNYKEITGKDMTGLTSPAQIKIKELEDEIVVLKKLKNK